MISKTKKAARTAAAAIIASAAFTMIGPAGTSFAINEVACADGENFLKIWAHPSGGDTREYCYANGGKMPFGGWWITQISTGNNAVTLHDHNGEQVKLEPWTNMMYPNNPPKIDDIEIR